MAIPRSVLRVGDKWLNRGRFLWLLLALLAPAFAVDVPVRILKLEPTVLFPNTEPLSQVAWLQVESIMTAPLACDLVVRVEGQEQHRSQSIVLPPGYSRQDLLVPDLLSPAIVTVEIRSDGHILASQAQRWEPQRKWKVFMVKSSHEDIGYEDFLWVKQKEIADFIEIGRRLSVPSVPLDSEPSPGREGFRYWLETLLFPRYYAAERYEVALRELIENAIKPGKLPLAGAPSGIHAHWMDYEELVRMTYPGRRAYKDRFNLDLDTFALVDNPSFSWSSVQALAGAGYKYAVRFGQSWRTGGNNDYQTTGVPAVFWWEGPDRNSRVLFTWRPHYRIHFWFGQSDRAFADLDGLGAVSIQQELSAVEDGNVLGPYPWDALLVPSYRDHEAPVWDNRALSEWRARFRYPDIRVANPRDFMVYMETCHGEALPTLRGDLNNFSADYAAIDPMSQGSKRRAARVLPLAEGLGAVAGRLDPAFLLPPSEVDRAYLRLFDYDEHSWPTKPSRGDVHRFNAQWGKILEGGRALLDAELLLDRSWKGISGHIATGSHRELMVLNPLAHARTDLVVTREKVAGLVDLITGESVPLQELSDGQTVFMASDVPPFGYKTFRIVSAPAEAAPALEVTDGRLENEYYSIQFDLSSGAIVSIRDRQLDRELVDPSASYLFNQLVWVSKTDSESKQGVNYAPRSGATLKARTGPIVAEMIATICDPRLGDAVLTQTVRLYRGIKRIDVSNDLRHVGVLSSPDDEDRYRENIFYAFPLKVEDSTPRAEYAGGVVRPHDDQLRWGSHDYLSANRWVDVSNASFGVTMALHNAPVVHFGAIRYNEFSVDYKPASSHLYGYAWSNRMDGLATLCPDDMNARVAYSFTSHTGDWDAGDTTRFGWSVASPLEVRLLPANQTGPLPAGAASFASVDAPNVQMTVLKESNQPGRGWIVRMVETEGKPVDATLDLSRFPFNSAALCDLVENDLSPLAVRAGSVKVPIAPFSFVTVRLFTTDAAPPAPEAVAIEAWSDSTLRLRWPAVPGALGYNLFRSVDPDEPPTAHTLVGRSTTPEFVDTGLHLDTTYYYHVAAFAAGNTQGPVSLRTVARTTEANATPPAPIGDFDVVRLSPDRLLVCWAKSPEPDVARYFLYRGDRADFDPRSREPIAVVKPSGFYLDHYVDTDLQPGRTYFYQVHPEDWAENRQTHSAVAAGTTPKPSS